VSAHIRRGNGLQHILVQNLMALTRRVCLHEPPLVQQRQKPQLQLRRHRHQPRLPGSLNVHTEYARIHPCDAMRVPSEQDGRATLVTTAHDRSPHLSHFCTSARSCGGSSPPGRKRVFMRTKSTERRSIRGQVCR
jgi:hypothetical protein